MPPELLGPFALTVAALIAVGVMWREHLKHDADIRLDRDYWRDLALRGAELADKATSSAARRR